MTNATATATRSTVRPVGELLRQWRTRRRLSQLELAGRIEISTRHLSFVETNRSSPSRDLVLQLADGLDVPLRERNRLLIAAGFAPLYGATSLDAPELAAVRDAVRRLLHAHEPFPAAVVDAQWDLVDANAPIAVLTEGVAPELLEPPGNVLRVSLHPGGMLRRIVNRAEWRAHLISRARRQVEMTNDARLAALLAEVAAYPLDITVEELAIESFYTIPLTPRPRARSVRPLAANSSRAVPVAPYRFLRFVARERLFSL